MAAILPDKNLTLLYKQPIDEANRVDVLSDDPLLTKPVYPIQDYQPYPNNVPDPIEGNPYNPPPEYHEDISEGRTGGTTFIPGNTSIPETLEPATPTMAGIDPKILLIGAGALVVGILLIKIL